MELCILLDVVARYGQKRTDNLAVYDADACQSFESRTPQQVDEKSLNAIVGVVRYGYGVVALVEAQLVKPRVTQPASRHLYTLAREGHLARSVKAAIVVGHAEFLGLLGNQYLILVALGSPQAEIAVRNAHLVARLHKEVHHYH